MIVTWHPVTYTSAGDTDWGQKNAALLDKLEENQEAFAEIFEVMITFVRLCVCDQTPSFE